jgi:putative GTP pyrophosphokinase
MTVDRNSLARGVDLGVVDVARLVQRAGGDGPEPGSTAEAARRREAQVRPVLTRFLLEYKFGLEELCTKLRILEEEFLALHDYNPIENVSARLKSTASLLEKVERKGVDLTLQAVRESITDIAGIRVTCTFESDVYRVLGMLTRQADLEVVRIKDYIVDPKPNGYRSLHLIVTVPVFMTESVVNVPVEIQLRTVAMDFWATLEHKIFYKYRGDTPPGVLDTLRQAALTAQGMDSAMEQLHSQLHGALGADAPEVRQAGRTPCSS